MLLIKRYIAKEFTVYFLVCFLSLVAIAVMFSALAELSHLKEENGTRLFFEAILSGVPLLVEVIAPISILLATVLAFISLSKSSEIVAMMAAGVSLFHLVLPVLLCVFVISVFLYINQSHLAPLWGADKRASLVRSVASNDVWRFYKGTLYQFSDIDKRKKTLSLARYFEFDEQFAIRQTGAYEQLSLFETNWEIEKKRDVEIFEKGINQVSGQHQLLNNEKMPVVFSNEIINPKYASFSLLWSEISIKKEGAVDFRKELFAVFQKISGLVAVFIMVLLALPFSIYSGRSANVRTGIVISVILGFVFWLVDQIMISLADAGSFPLVISAFGANVFFILLALALIRLKQA